MSTAVAAFFFFFVNENVFEKILKPVFLVEYNQSNKQVDKY